MFLSSAIVFPLTSLKAMVNDQDKGWKYRCIDSYRPAASSRARSPTIATEFEAIRHHSNKSWHRAKYSNNTTQPGDASSTLESSRGQPQHHSPPTTPVTDQKSPSTGHDPEQLTQMPVETRKNVSMSETTPSRRSSSTAHHDKTNESEAQSRGFYGSSRSATSNTTYLGRFELKRPGDDEATDRSIKRRRDVEEKKDEDEDEDEPESVNASENYRMPKRFHCKNYMCMGYHEYADCPKPKICWGCRSTG